MIYDNIIREYGPYKGKDGRLRLVLVFKDKTKKSISYPKYLMEKHLNRYLSENETVDHIDGNPLNNDLSNLRVLDRSEHCKNDVVRNKDVTTTCIYCGKEFTISGNSMHNRNRKDKNNSGYFCSKECSGKYGSEIKNQKREVKPVENIKPEKYRLHKKE